MTVNRNLKVKSITYLCDLGNIETTDGHHVKPGLLYRSSALNKMNEKAYNKLMNTFQIKRVFDLRTKEEVAYKEDANRSDVEYHNYELLEDADNPVINRKNRFGVFKDIRKNDGKTLNYLSRIYRKMIYSPLAIQGFKNCFNDLKEKAVPTIWHCSQGKDRTGLTTFLLLSSLGVKEETCVKDYMSFNKHCRMKNFWIFLGVSVVKLNPRMANDLVNLLRARKQYINSALDEIKKTYGTVDNYLRVAIGLTDEDFARLKELYLE